MTDLLAQVTPLIKGIIWLPSGAPGMQKKFYKEIDYLLSGLLTATLRADPKNAHVLIGSNFGQPFYVFCAQSPDSKQLLNFLDLIGPKLETETSLLLIDESGVFADFRQYINPGLLNKIQPIQ